MVRHTNSAWPNVDCADCGNSILVGFQMMTLLYCPICENYISEVI